MGRGRGHHLRLAASLALSDPSLFEGAVLLLNRTFKPITLIREGNASLMSGPNHNK